jgi:uncharacterized protein YdcH (DUF465 family)
VHNVCDIKHIKPHKAESFIPGPNHLKAETVITHLKNYKLQLSDKIQAQLIQAGGETLL